MLQAVLRDVFLRPDWWTRVKVLADEGPMNIGQTAVLFEWTCMGFGMSQCNHPGISFRVSDSTVPVTSGLFDWYKSIYGTPNGKDDDDKSLDDPAAAFYSTPDDDTMTKNHEAPPPPPEKLKKVIVEHLIKDVIFGERVQSAYLFVGAYPVGITKGKDENTRLLDVSFRAQFHVTIKISD